MSAIWKFPLNFFLDGVDELEVDMPVGAKIFCVGPDGKHALCAWAMVDPDAAKETRFFEMHCTGATEILLADQLEHLRTITDGVLVQHVFERVIR